MEGAVLPPLPDKPLLVFVSHRHEDHFNPEVFTLADRKADIQFLLGSDFHLLSHNLKSGSLPGDRRKMPPLRQA